MASDINVQHITNHVICLYNQYTETSDKCNFKPTYVEGKGTATWQFFDRNTYSKLETVTQRRPIVDNLKK